MTMSNVFGACNPSAAGQALAAAEVGTVAAEVGTVAAEVGTVAAAEVGVGQM